MMELRAVSERMDLPETGIYVRAKNEAETWGAFDIAHLDRDSLLTWLHGDNRMAENVVLILLGHKTVAYTTADGDCDAKG